MTEGAPHDFARHVRAGNDFMYIANIVICTTTVIAVLHQISEGQCFLLSKPDRLILHGITVFILPCLIVFTLLLVIVST